MTTCTPAMPLLGETSVWASLFRSSTRILQGDDLKPFHNRTLAVLSPRPDDACFSLGAFLAHMSSGHLINVFARDEDAGASDVRASGAQEDAAFAARCRLVRHDLGCDDPARISAPVLASLDLIMAAKPARQRGTLLCPLGIGRHANHRALPALVLEHLPRLQRDFDVHFYEELPHASSMVARELALRRLRQRATLSTRHAFPARWSIKRELLQLYPSRFRAAPRPAQFNPAALFHAFSHEAFWSIA